MRKRWLAAPLAFGAAAIITACGSSAPSTGAAAPANSGAAASQQGAATTVTIKTLSTSKGTVLTTASGMTLYWFASDSASASKCTGSCATVWPPVLGTAVAAPGTSLPHGFGTITRSNGQKQVTYDGHPLYTYEADTAPGQIKGNGLKDSFGLWWAITPTAAKLSGSSSGSSGSSGSSSGGYGY